MRIFLVMPLSPYYSSDAGNGTVKMKFAPSPGRLSTQSLPPKYSMICRLMGSPKPVPWACRSACFHPDGIFENDAAFLGRQAGTIVRNFDTNAIAIDADPHMDLAAAARNKLDRIGQQVDITCVRRSRSACTTGPWAGMSLLNATPLSRNNWPRESIVSRPPRQDRPHRSPFRTP
jgi:hypothetical protein